MPRRWQYPSWALIDTKQLTLPEVTTPDKWWQPFTEPVRQHAGKIAFAAIIASGVAPIDADALTRPEVTSLDKWYQPLSEPVRVKKPLPIAAYPSTWVDADLLTQPEATSLDKWFAPLAEPVPPVPGIEQALISSGNIFFTDEKDLDLSAEELSWYKNLGGIGVKKELRLSGPTSFPVPAIAAEDITLDEWYSPLSEPVLIKPRASEFPTHTNDTEGLTQPEVTSLDKWYAPLSEPVLVKEPINVSSGNIFTEEDLVAAEEITLDKWYQPFSEFLNARARSGAELDASGLIYQGEPSDFDPTAEFMGWFVSLDEPTLPKLRVAEFLPWVVDVEAITQPETTSLDRWYSPFSEPVRTQPISHAALVASGLVYVGEPRDEDPTAEQLGWYVTLSEPTLPKLRVAEFPSFVTDDESLGDGENITLDKWYAPFSEYLHKDARSEAALLSGNNYEGEPADFEPTAEFLGWYVPLSQFLYSDKRIDAALYPYFWMDEDALTRPEVTTPDKWWQPLSEFLHRVKRSAASLEPASVIDSDLLTQPEETLVSKWVPQTNEPVRVKKGLLTALQEAYFPDTDLADIPPAEEITLDKWYQPHSEPVLVKARASEFPTSTNDTEGLTQPEVTSLDKWFVTLSEPIRTQPTSLAGLLSGEIQIGEQGDIDPLAEFLGWYRDLSQPTYPRVLPVSNYPATFYQDEVSELDPTAERLAWYVDLSTPTLPKVRVAEFPSYVIDSDLLTQPEVTSIDKWWKELSEPVRVKTRLHESLQVHFITDPAPEVVPVTVDSWFVPFSEPYFIIDPTTPLKPYLFIDPEVLTLPENITLDKWWQKLSEPVLVKARFLEALQLHVVTDIQPFVVEVITLDKWYMPLVEPVRIGDRLIVPFRLPASVGREYQTATVIIKGRISKEADQTHVSKEADQTHISKEADQTKDSKRC